MQELLQAGWAGAGGLGAESSLALLPGNLCTASPNLLALPHAKAKPRTAELSLPLSLPVPSVSPGAVLGLARIYLPALWIFSKGKGTAGEVEAVCCFVGLWQTKANCSPCTVLQGDKGHCHSKVWPPHRAARPFSVATSSQEPALGGKGEKTSRLVALGARRWHGGIPACTDLQNGGMP